MFNSNLLLVILSTVLTVVASETRYGYKNGFGYYGNKFGCGGNQWYYTICPDRTNTPGFCGDTLSCSQFTNYTCISPGICCRNAIANNACPTGLQATGFFCSRNNRCSGTGLQCYNGICCIGTISGSCPNGQLGIGTCLPTASGLSCGTGFTCQTVGTQNFCCPSTTSGSGSSNSICQRGGSTNRRCISSKSCNRGESCFNNRCCLNSSTRSALSHEKVCNSTTDSKPTGICSKRKTTCPSGSKCADNGFCCQEV